MLTNRKITFEDMSLRYGEITAYQYLEQIERAACLKPQHLVDNPEIRLANALRVQDQKFEIIGTALNETSSAD
jgi:hypothetical protein